MKDKARIIEDKILDLIDCSNDIPKGDIQGVVTVATQDIIELFNNSINKELLEVCKDARRQIEMMIERLPVNKMTCSDSEMISILSQTINKAEVTKWK